MEFSSNNKQNNNNSNHFSEVDEDLRRIANREQTKQLCPFGQRCYRKNPNHFKDWIHSSDKQTDDHSLVKTCNQKSKITDFFNRKPIGIKKLSLEKPNDESDYEIEDDSDDEKNVSINRLNNSYETPPKRKKFSPIKTRKTDNNRKTNRGLNGSKFGSNDKCDEDLEAVLKPKRMYKSPVRRRASKLNDEIFSPYLKKLEQISEPVDKSEHKIEAKTNAQNVMENDTKNTPKNPYKLKTESEIKAKTENDLKNESNKKPNTVVENEPKTDIKKFNKNFNSIEHSFNQSPSQTKPKLSPKELNLIIKDIFLFEMPEDFFYFWRFCKSLKPEKPEDALIDTLGYRLVGPYDILTGKVKKGLIKDKNAILCHWRYYYDLPEFQTIIASINSEYHLGYFRDTPEDEKPVIVSNNSEKSCIIEGIGDNIFSAMFTEIQKHKQISTESKNKSLLEIETKIKEFCNRNKINFRANTRLKSRKSNVNALTFNKFGFVVPVDDSGVGYRSLPQTDTELKKLLTRICSVDLEDRDTSKSLTDLKEIIQLIDYANDECDFGMGLELAIDLFSFGDNYFHKSIQFMFTNAYRLLNRDVFSQIIRAHLDNRRKGFNLDFNYI